MLRVVSYVSRLERSAICILARDAKLAPISTDSSTQSALLRGDAVYFANRASNHGAGIAHKINAPVTHKYSRVDRRETARCASASSRNELGASRDRVPVSVSSLPIMCAN